MTACTGGSLRGSSSGWSPPAAIPVPKDTGNRLNEGQPLDPLDNAVSVTNSAAFAQGQILQIGDEQLHVTGIRDGELIVERGYNRTAPQLHADESPIYSVGEAAVVFISSKQGEVIALYTEGARDPAVLWSFSQIGEEE